MLIMWLVIFLVIIAPIFVAICLPKKEKSRHLLSGPRGLPFIGNLLEFKKPYKARHLWKLSRQYGPVMYLKIGAKPIFVVSSAKMAEQVLKTQDLVYCTRPLLTGIHKLSYNGSDLVFSSYGSEWRELKKTCIVYFFNSHRIKSFRPIRENEVSHLLQKICTFAAAEPNSSFNLTEAMLEFTSSLICKVAFRKRYEHNGSEGNKCHDLFKETEALFAAFYYSDYFPGGVGWIIDKVSGLLGRLEKHFIKLDVFYQKLIDEHLETHKTLKLEEYTILDILIQIRNDGSSKVDMTIDCIKALLMNIFIAGTGTSAVTVIWAIAFLMKNPRAMKKVQDEIREHVGTRGFVNEDDIESLRYLQAVVKETMRLQPPAPLLAPREAMEKSVLGGFEVQPKTMVYVNAWAIGRDPEVWENPLEFNPERFVGSSIDVKGNDFGLIPFGGGRRICPGILMGFTNVELSLSNLLYKFDWEMPAGMLREELDTVLPGLTVNMKNPLCLVPKTFVP